MDSELPIDSFTGVINNLSFLDESGICPAHPGYLNTEGVYFDSRAKDGPKFVAAFQIQRGCTTWIETRRIELKERGMVVGESLGEKLLGASPTDDELKQAALNSVTFHLTEISKE